ncbi:MAG: glycosyltransferase, partial [Promethearchaeota archaeon]
MIITTLNPVSIVVPIKNRSELLPNLIKNLLNIDYPEFEIIIVDDHSLDNTKELLKVYPIKSISLHRSVGSAKARNIGIKMAKYDIIAITDSDCIVSKNWLRNLIPYLKDFDVVGGKVVFSDQAEKGLNPFNNNNEIIITEHSNLNFLNTSNMILKKDTWKLSGGFLNQRIEDLEFSWRLLKKGFKLVYSPKGSVIHFDNRNPIQNIKKYLQYGKSYSSIAYIHNMSFPFKTDRILGRNGLLDFIKLISFPFLLLLVSLILNYIVLNVMFNLTFNVISYILCFYILLKQIGRFNLLFKIYKFSILFAIVNYTLIYLTKRKYK